MDRAVTKKDESNDRIVHESSEYMLVAFPNDVVNKKLVEIQKEFLEKYGPSIGGTTPFVTTACFLAKEEMEETLFRWMQRICGQLKSFSVTLNNYSGIPLHTLYLRVFDHQPFRQLANQLKVVDQFIRSNDCPEAKLTTRPYLPIAKGLTGDLYEKSMKDYSLKSFCETFRVNELVLMKKRGHQNNFKKVTVFPFLP
jgi:hypothetical protein